MSLIKELQRRHVFKAGVAYVIVAWLILQVSDVVLGQIGVPDWVFKFILFLIVIGFPLILMFAWAYDLTPAGLTRTASSDTEAADETTAVGEAEPADVFSRASVAVLPFVNMSGNQENEYFSDGLSEELLNALAKVSSLKVAARTSSFHFKGHTGDIADVARRLGVGSVLEGSVRQSGANIRITVQLINAHDGYHLWSETYDRQLDDIFEVQDEIARSVVKALKVKLLGEESANINLGGTTNPDAFNEYLKGMHYLNRGSDAIALNSAVDAYQRAVDLDPEYAQAYSGLAVALMQLATNNFADLDQIVDKAYEAANKSIELAPGLADGYPVLSNIAFTFRLDRVAARKAIDTALKLDPGNVRIHMENSTLSLFTGNIEASLASSRIAQELDPHFPRPRYGIAMCRFMLGDIESAATELTKEPLDWMLFSGTAILQQKLGHKEAAESAMASLITSHRDNGLYQQAQVYAQWGDLDQSMQALIRAHEFGDPGVSQLVMDPLLNPLRGKPQFSELMATIGFG